MALNIWIQVYNQSFFFEVRPPVCARKWLIITPDKYRDKGPLLSKTYITNLKLQVLFHKGKHPYDQFSKTKLSVVRLFKCLSMRYEYKKKKCVQCIEFLFSHMAAWAPL